VAALDGDTETGGHATVAFWRSRRRRRAGRRDCGRAPRNGRRSG